MEEEQASQTTRLSAETLLVTCFPHSRIVRAPPRRPPPPRPPRHPVYLPAVELSVCGFAVPMLLLSKAGSAGTRMQTGHGV